MSRVSAPCIMSQLGLVPNRPIEPVQNGTSSGTAALPSSALATPAPSSVGDRDDLVGGVQCPLTDQHRDLLAGIEDVRGAPADRRSLGITRRGVVTRARVHRVVRVRLLFHRVHLLHISWDDDARQATVSSAARCARPGPRVAGFCPGSLPARTYCRATS